MILVPAKAGSKVNESVSDSWFPEPATEEPAELIVHMLLCRAPEEPRVIGPSRSEPVPLQR